MLCYENDDLVYYSESGQRYTLMECMTMGKNGLKHSDIVVAFKEDEDGFPVFVNWFAGAFMADDYKDDFLEACRQFIDSKEVEQNG